MKLFAELRRRNVFRVGAAYLVLGWLVIQVTDTVSPALNLPDWTLALVTWFGIIGFPLALFFAWAYELTPDGIRRETDIDGAEWTTDATGRKLDIVLIILLIVAIGFVAWDRFSDAPDGAAPVSDLPSDTGAVDGNPPASESIAVLPLLNMSAETDNAFFAGGVHEEILTNLSHIKNLRVVSRTTAFRYMDSALSLKDIGRELGVRYIVEGSVRRIGNHVRITVQLIDAVDDAHLWANNYDRELVDVFATQSEVAREITNSLHLEIQPESVASLDDMPTRSVKAYDRYLKAKSIDRSEYQTESSLQLQRELLEAAITEDPNFVEAWAYLNEMLDDIARTMIQNDWFGETRAERETNFAETREAAGRALRKAVALDPDNIETLLAQASDFVTEQEDIEYRTGRKNFIDRAIELRPDSGFTWYVLAWWHRIEGDYESATPAFRKALEFDPLHARIVAGSLEHFRSIGNEEMTTRLFERLTQIAPETGQDKSLVEISSFARVTNFIVRFGNTADESIIESYAAEFAKSVGTFDSQSEETWSRVRLLELRNDLDGMLDLEIGVLPENPDWAQARAYFIMNDMVLAAQRLAGRSDGAATTAMRTIDARAITESFSDSQLSFFDRFTIAAHVVLRDEDRMREIGNSLFNEDGRLVDEYQISSFVAVSRLDLEQAVELLLAQKAKYPAWYGTDVVAMFHIWSRHMITHPDLQAFYVDEGKWIDYLAARVPEYARYRR